MNYFRGLCFGYSLGRDLLATAISRCQKTIHSKTPAIKLPTMELAKLTTSLFSQGEGQDTEDVHLLCSVFAL